MKRRQRSPRDKADSTRERAQLLAASVKKKRHSARRNQPETLPKLSAASQRIAFRKRDSLSVGVLVKVDDEWLVRITNWGQRAEFVLVEYEERPHILRLRRQRWDQLPTSLQYDPYEYWTYQ